MQRLILIGLAVSLLGCVENTEKSQDNPKKNPLAELVLRGEKTKMPPQTPAKSISNRSRPTASASKSSTPNAPLPTTASERQSTAAHEPPAVQMPDLPQSAVRLTYLPYGLDIVLSIRVSELWNAPAMKSLVDKAGPMAQNPLAQFMTRIGLAPQDIDRITLGAYGVTEDVVRGVTNNSRLQNRGRPGNRSRKRANPEGERDSAVVFVVQTHEAFEIPTILSGVARSEPVDFSRREYYRLFGDGVPESLSVFFPEEKTLVFGNENKLKALLGQLDSAPPRTLGLRSLNASHHVLVEFSTSLRPAVRQLFDLNVAGAPNTSFMSRVVRRQVNHFGLTIHAADRFIAQLQLGCGNKPGAADVLKVFDATLTQWRMTGVPANSASLQPLSQTIVPILASGHTARDDYVVTVTAAVPPSAFPFEFMAKLTGFGVDRLNGDSLDPKVGNDSP